MSSGRNSVSGSSLQTSKHSQRYVYTMHKRTAPEWHLTMLNMLGQHPVSFGQICLLRVALLRVLCMYVRGIATEPAKAENA